MPPVPPALADIIGERRWVRVDDGESGAGVHRLVGGPVDLFLKCGEGGLADAVLDEAARLRWLASRLPAARVVASEAFRGHGWLLTEALPGQSAGAWLSKYPDRANELVGAVAGTCVRYMICRLTNARSIRALPHGYPRLATVLRQGWLTKTTSTRIIADGARNRSSQRSRLSQLALPGGSSCMAICRLVTCSSTTPVTSAAASTRGGLESRTRTRTLPFVGATWEGSARRRRRCSSLRSR